LVLTGDRRFEEANPPARIEPLIAPSVNRGRTPGQETASRLLGVASRAAPRLPIRLHVQLQKGRAVVIGRSEDVSKTGMLIRVEGSFAVGTKVVFEIHLPGDPTPVRGEAVIVHHTVVGNEQVPASGLRFLAGKSNGLRRLRFFVGREVFSG
jgi:hypothetical protein